ncbi:hypothetical protein B4N89_45635 [Embleya scabrispora]|uniref:Uncharacterized protein n=1 Tax=Embleya scabrispora TaxID=159449 RepID=A0A1T3NIX7_9ACTN|nr:hypothetical protein B4N89_45635 [Embleya scabrispora]
MYAACWGARARTRRRGDDVAAAGLRGVATRLTALLGNLTFCLGGHTCAQVHLAAAALSGERGGSDNLRA